jgi:Curli production assembly/transport component CsgG/Glucodextranase, domain B
LSQRYRPQARAWFVLGLFLLLCVIAACAVEQGKVYRKDGQQYGVTSSLIWRGQWWNYYERGSSYAEGAFWPDAMADFQAAIRQREVDQRRARTYGLHFIDYFPHRELGIAYYHLGRYPEAAHELETSLQTVDTAKAKFYLNKTRQVLFGQTKQGAPPPRILIDGPLDGLLTNRFSIKVTGSAAADTHISTITINGHALFIELAEPSVSFAQDIALQDGPNPIEIVAVDLLGRPTRHLVTVHMDRHGPQVSIDTVELLAEAPQQQVRVKGFLSDRSRVVRFLLAGRSVPMLSEREWEFREEVSVTAGMAAIPFEAEDAAGNVTRGEIGPSPPSNGQPGIQKGEPGLPLLPRWAFLTSGAGVFDFPTFRAVPPWTAQGSGRAPPVIKLTALAAQQVVYYDAIYLEGKITSVSAIRAISINNEPLWPRKSRQVFFGQLVALQPGDNRFVLEAEDEAGNKVRQDIIVTRTIAGARRLDARLRVFLLPPVKQGQPSALGDTVYDRLFNALINQKRFELVERQQLEVILRELKLSQTELVDEATAARIGKIVAAEGILIGAVTETPQALEVFLRFVDVETAVALAAEDVYGEDLTFRAVGALMDGLAWKFRQRFPLLEGSVVRTEGKHVFVDLGSKHAISKYMKLILFREGEVLKHPLTGRDLGPRTETLGEARVEVVLEEHSQATLLAPATSAAVRQLDRVITK